MKKEEIDDRLIDALLRGKSQADMAQCLAQANASKIRKVRLVRIVLAMAAVLVLGTIGVVISQENQGKNLGLTLDTEIEEQKAKVEEKKVIGTLAEVPKRPNLESSDHSSISSTSSFQGPLSSKVKAAQTSSPSAIPVPHVETPVAAIDFGSGDDFGAGWGSGGGGGGGGGMSFFGKAPTDAVPFAAKSVGGLTRDFARLANGDEEYGQLVDLPWKAPGQDPLSTFSVDVDTASYTNVRRLINDGSPVPRDAVRIEEFINYFDYNYPQPEADQSFRVALDLANCPWQPKHHLVRVALQGKTVKMDERGDAHLVFLIDVSGSMQDSDKLPLLVESLGLLVESLRENDRVSIVVYAGSEGLVLEPTKMGKGGREKVTAALKRLSAGGATNGGAGIHLAYNLAQQNFVNGGVNRVILATDGDFNVGTTSNDALVALVKARAKDGVFLSVCGFGRGNLNDALLEAITNDGNGVYYYVDSLKEGRRVFSENLMGTLVTIAKDVKIQVEFNPAKVSEYRLIGYANRILRKEDFNDDKVDAGDVGSGHQVTAFYEIIPTGVTDSVRPKVDGLKYQPQLEEVAPVSNSPDWLTVKLRHKLPDKDVSQLQEFVLQGKAKSWKDMDSDFRFASGVALWGMKLRELPESDGQEKILSGLLGKPRDDQEKRRELLMLVDGME